jgi:four helix bundle protein
VLSNLKKIHERTFDFALLIIELYKYLVARDEHIMSKQLLQCGTSIGANIHEAQAAQSRKDFASKMAIASKEARETDYWRKLLDRSGYIGAFLRKEEVFAESTGIINILTRIVKSSSPSVPSSTQHSTLNTQNAKRSLMLASRIILIGMIVLIVGAPIAIGAVHIISYSAMELLIFCLLLLHLWTTDFWRLDSQMSAAPRSAVNSKLNTQNSTRSPIPSSSYLRRTLLLMLPLFLFLLFCLFQMVPLPFTLLQKLSPGAAALYARLGFSSTQHSTLNTQHFLMPLTLSLSVTSAALLKWLAYGSVFFLAATFTPQGWGFSPQTWITWLFVALFVIGFAEAVYGLYIYLNQSDQLLWFRKKYYTDCVTGTYVNRNHFAGLMELSIPISVGLFASRIGLGKRERGVLSLYFLFLGLVIMVLALIFSMSRMGQFSLIVGAIFVGALYMMALMKRRGRRGGTLLIASLLVLCLGGLWGVWKGLEPVEDRWSAIASSYEDRSVVWQSTMKLFHNFPLVGTGLGTYELAYPPYKPDKLGATIMDHAHNDYLEFLSEVGLAGFIPWLAFFLLFLCLTVRAWFRRRNTFSIFIGAGGLAAAFALLLHSLADFNLQIPANAMLLFLVMGLTWRTVNSSTALQRV